jgi:multidrug resistance efflux pump
VQSRPQTNEPQRDPGEAAVPAPPDAGTPPGLGVREQLDLLKQFETAEPAEPSGDAVPRQLQRAVKSVLTRRVIKTLIALALVFGLGWMPLQRLLLVTSAEATVNARVITLRAPIDGQIIDWRRNSRVGTAVHPGETILNIVNPRADRSRLDALRRDLTTLTDQRQASADRIARLEAERADQLTKFSTFVRYRVAHLEARRDEVIADQRAAKARLDTANAALARVSTLFGRGVQAQAALDDAVRAQSVASASLNAVDFRLRAAEIELRAAREGTFVADGFNDIPRSAQRANELGQMMADIQVTIAEQDRRIANLKSQVADEAKLYDMHATAVMTSPTDGQIWENLTSPGEDIRRGQDLMKLLDCKATIVTAAVSEANFNKLNIGSPASFRLRGESEELPGHVIGLYGLAAVVANLAINQGTLSREPYHVAIEVPALVSRGKCEIGRTGIVTFHGQPAAKPAS